MNFALKSQNFLVNFQDFTAPTSVFFCSKFLHPTDQNKGKMRIFCANSLLKNSTIQEKKIFLEKNSSHFK
jgi:hypothetical protein